MGFKDIVDSETVIGFSTSKFINWSRNNSINSKKILPICCLQIREFFFQTLNLEQFLKFYNVNYKILIFKLDVLMYLVMVWEMLYANQECYQKLLWSFE